nr:tetratricopeptide repeat protein [Anaerolineae bacterium]
PVNVPPQTPPSGPAIPDFEFPPEPVRAEPSAEAPAPVMSEPSPFGTESLLPTPPAPDGVPLVSMEAINKARSEVDPILARLDARQQTGALAIQWASPEVLRRKIKGRIDLRPTPMMAIIAGALLIVVVAIVLTTIITNRIREIQIAARITPSPSPTVTFTPAPTVTPVPSRTPTPSGQESPDEPILSIEEVPRGNLAYGMTATPIYVATPHRSNPSMDQAIVAYHDGWYEEALNLIELARQREPDLLDGYFYEAMSLYQLGRYADARDAVDAGLDVNSDFAPLHLVDGILLEQDGDAKEARQAFEHAIDLDPDLVDAYLYLGDNHLASGEYSAALADAQQALASSRYDIRALALASRAYYGMEDMVNAAAYANLAYYIDPTAEVAAIAQAKARLALDFNDLALIGLETYLFDIYPSSARGWALLGQAYGRAGRDIEAQMAYARALQLSEDVTEAKIGRGIYYFERGDYARAYEDFAEGFTAVQPTDDLLLRYAISAYAVGEYAEAVDALEQYRATHSDELHPARETLYAMALIADGQYNEALAVATLAINNLELGLNNEQRASMLEVRGRAFFLMGDYPNAQYELDQALSLVETGSRHYYKALALEAQGFNRQAVRELEWVVFWDSVYGYAFSEDAAERLAALQAESEPVEATPEPGG